MKKKEKKSKMRLTTLIPEENPREQKEANATFTVSLQLLRPTNRTVLRVCMATPTPYLSLSLSIPPPLCRYVIEPLRQTNPTSNFCAKLYAFLC